ncbi:MAG: B12-binding domain-containing radical SAM protein [Candidatus Ratteibacteria bacterium]
MDKIIFINPYARVNFDIPNLGLAYIATYFNVKVIDLNTKKFPKNRYLKYKVKTLGISIQSRTFNEAIRIAQTYKRRYPDTQIKSVLGIIDIQCCYPYIEFKEKIYVDIPFSDQLPFPNYELFDSFSIFLKNWQEGRWNYPIMTSQGCPYQCIYCVSRNRKYLTRSPENCYEELKIAKEKWGIRSFSILDDCFNVDKRRVIKFCELIKNLNLSWSCANGLRADRFDEEMAEALKESGCSHISFGIESIDDDVLKIIKKGETSQDIEKAIIIAKKYFNSVNGFFIIGLPGSSYEKDLKSLDWAKKMGINAHFSYYIPFDKGLQYDLLFYGEKAKPVSDVYSKKLQRKLYKITSSMRPINSFNSIIIKKIKKFLK